MSDDIAQIVEKLTKAQRMLLTGAFDRPLRRASFAQIRAALIRKGLLDFVGFTRRGLAVRDYLKETEHGE